MNLTGFVSYYEYNSNGTVINPWTVTPPATSTYYSVVASTIETSVVDTGNITI